MKDASFADRLRKARRALGPTVTVRKAATLIGVPWRTLEGWEQGHRTPDAFKQKAVLERLR